LSDLALAGLRSYLENFGTRFGADWLGKLKMGLQCAAVIAIFVVLQNPDWLADWTQWGHWLRDGLVYAMLLATLLSGLQYLWRAALTIRADGP